MSAMLFALLAMPAAMADDSNSADISSQPADRQADEFSMPELEARSRLETAPSTETEALDPILADWYRERFLWHPSQPLPATEGMENGCLVHLTKKEWAHPRRDGLYRYLRRKALHYFKREYRRELRTKLEKDPSFSITNYEEGLKAWGEGSFLHDIMSRPVNLSGISGRKRQQAAPPEPYIARLGPFRVDEVYRLELDLQDIWAPEAPEDVPVRSIRSTARTLRIPSKRRWVRVRVSPTVNIRVGDGLQPDQLLRNYGAKVKVRVLPTRDAGPLFSCSVRLKMDLHGEGRLTLNLIEKRF